MKTPHSTGSGNMGRPYIPLEKMPQQERASNPEEDWTGIVNRLDRKKLQNRLNQRIYRRRKMNQAILETWSELVGSTPQPAEQAVSSWRHKAARPATGENNLLDRSTAVIPSHSATKGSSNDFLGIKCPATLCDLDPATIERLMADVESWAYNNYMRRSLRADNLFTLVQFNVFRAMARNASILGFGMIWLEQEAVSPFNTTGLERTEATLPLSLQPTMLQYMIPHHPWLDLLPSPKLRDNLLLAGGELDEDKLCTDILGFSGHSTGLIVWSESWDPNEWEVTGDFARNWDWALRDCSDIQRSTNNWRHKRRMSPLFVEVSSDNTLSLDSLYERNTGL